MKYLCIFLIRLYRRLLSPLKRQPTCRFEPTCSAYALEAFAKRGFFAGMILTVARIARCQPFCAGGYDPVPPYGLRRRPAIPMTKYYYPEEYGLLESSDQQP
jgi:putative membrane protein insertion efficiency factor